MRCDSEVWYVRDQRFGHLSRPKDNGEAACIAHKFLVMAAEINDPNGALKVEDACSLRRRNLAHAVSKDHRWSKSKLDQAMGGRRLDSENQG